ncbi:ArgE/DapE family deacylase [Staphylococcus intermedius]|uniref:Probable succinyl-diaminopimelate desuccinylase n=1 Tax=Staphylococcus intermedius NCTC 11048 TaxID=1141106 RepID=A0A380G2T7_STAIN|nr:ArgE/DapE family deacylase [Staphylococcus intermedius]PCF64204.1 succinyl-diaminopimelate desuccinylase [Staphylococcus intermedius]PCF78919.1 succinyl-diaminopimelate desuccinylase [Staphylococcus intermedius]PCF79891.1 succinyl-diaminopimelate desuccinylase [Staphylococcus intermedius]PCF89449.1 succinyl-diaminopimelate desuccinylase [Staphylococcus intermedius]PNZ50908.1 succinyl-diaminopimelate desuccinylase [Staphylococcus intermedius NCTC 11048]
MPVLSQDESIQILRDLIEMQSVNDHELKVAQYLHDLFEQYQINAQIIKLENSETRANLVAEIGSGQPVLAVSGHMDVVTVGDIATWHYEPFQLTEDDAGRLHGRGTADMKAGLAALVISMIEIKEAGLLNKGTIRLLATAGEEIESEGAALLQQQGYMDDVDALLIAEPSQEGMYYAHKGSMHVELTSRGKSAHSSMPELGINAITPVVNFIYHLNEAFQHVDQKNDIIGRPTLASTVFNGGDQVNSIPDKATALFNVRTVSEFNSQSFIDLFESIQQRVTNKDEQLTIQPYGDRAPVVTTGENAWVDLAQNLSEKYFGERVKKIAATGVTDASLLLKDKDEHFSFVTYGPGRMSQAHQVDEYVEKDVYLTFIELYQDMFTTYLNHEA